MTNKLIAKRYSKAFIDNLTEKAYTSILKDIKYLNKTLTATPECTKVINSFLFPLTERMELADEIIKNLENKNIWNNLFKILIQKHKFIIISDLLEEIEESILTSRNQIKIRLKIAHKHSPENLDKIKSFIIKIMSMDVIFDVIIDPEIIGGFKAESESFMIDGSVKNNLIKFKKFCAKTH